jgi:hypothetical protein
LKSIRLIYPNYIKQYEDLQSLCLGQVKNFRAKPEAARWYPFMSQSPALGVFHDEDLVSVMRLEWLRDERELNAQLNSQIEIPNIEFPVAHLAKGATLPQFEKMGFNSLLRYHCLLICLHRSIKYLLGTMIKGSPRVQTMQKMGYKFIENPTPWRGYYESDQLALIGILDLARDGQMALQFLQQTIPKLIEDYKPEFRLEGLQFPK